MQIRCGIKGNVGDILPARQSVSDRRINSSHGNNIFIFQGQRLSFFPSNCQWEGKISCVNSAPCSCGKEKRQNGQCDNNPFAIGYTLSLLKNGAGIEENQSTMNNEFIKISRVKIPCLRDKLVADLQELIFGVYILLLQYLPGAQVKGARKKIQGLQQQQMSSSTALPKALFRFRRNYWFNTFTLWKITWYIHRSACISLSSQQWKGCAGETSDVTLEGQGIWQRGETFPFNQASIERARESNPSRGKACNPLRNTEQTQTISSMKHQRELLLLWRAKNCCYTHSQALISSSRQRGLGINNISSLWCAGIGK